MAKKKSAENQATATAVCEMCGGYGYVLGEDGVARACECGIVGEEAEQRRIAESGIPAKFRNKTFENFKATDRERKAVVAAARSYATAFHRGEEEGLMLRGSTGSGKTHIAVAILREVIHRGFYGHYANFNDLLSRIRGSYQGGSGETEVGLLTEVDDADLLVLDDVGAESTSDWVRDRLYLIINRRYENARATIITTNCDEAELEARIGPRTASRLCEMCSSDFPPFPHQDWRKAMMR